MILLFKISPHGAGGFQMKNDGTHYSIGETSKLCNLSAKQLRYYDKLEIVSPAFRNEDTGYRYYTEAQLKDLMFLSDLRNIGVSLSAVREILLNRNLAHQRDELEKSRLEARAEVEKAQHKYELVIEALLRVTEAISLRSCQAPYIQSGISVIHLERRPVLINKMLADRDVRSDVTLLSAFSSLGKLAEEYGLTTTNSNMCVQYGSPFAQFSDDPSVRTGMIAAVQPLKDTTSCLLPCVAYLGGFDAISTLYVGDYRNMEEAYTRMVAWAGENELKIEGSAIEEYLVNLLMSGDPGDTITRLYLPLAGSILP